ncbi:hypothetical protein [Grimontia sp. NTOU-MAR1]|uniref:hypothetical protein n=1 Tax=Grimontia sp. NTOU-MAR1 TaxID=3111011 RepID=UPI002DB988DC|nr:hypothetical protein [Grimontia sp. NTOU-MAR1]WRV97857.1 hypothetical protein VP504_17835 [Grimontia sp. NTOU-MAR1]
MHGFIIFGDYCHHCEDCADEMSKWLMEGKIQYKEQIADGLVALPDAFIGQLEGKNSKSSW